MSGWFYNGYLSLLVIFYYNVRSKHCIDNKNRMHSNEREKERLWPCTIFPLLWSLWQMNQRAHVHNGTYARKKTSSYILFCETFGTRFNIAFFSFLVNNIQCFCLNKPATNNLHFIDTLFFDDHFFLFSFVCVVPFCQLILFLSLRMFLFMCLFKAHSCGF